MKYHLITYGCQMNTADSEEMARPLESRGFVARPRRSYLRLIRTLVGYSSQLMITGRSRYDNSCLFALFPRGLRIQCIKDRGANKDGEKEGNYIHTDTEQEGLPAADGVKCRAFHGFQIKKVFKGIMNSNFCITNELTPYFIRF